MIVSYFLTQQYVQTDIDSHKPGIDAVNEAAEKLIKTSSDHEKSHDIQSELNALNTRFNKINNGIRNHGDYLSKMLGRLTQLQTEVDNFEDWLLPMIEKLEARDLNRMELLELGTTLMVRFNKRLIRNKLRTGGGGGANSMPFGSSCTAKKMRMVPSNDIWCAAFQDESLMVHFCDA